MKAFNKVSRGLILVGVVALISKLLADNVLPNIGSVTLAIMIGMLIGNLPFIDPQYAAGFNFAEKKLLPLAIVCLGAEHRIFLHPARMASALESLQPFPATISSRHASCFRDQYWTWLISPIHGQQS